MTIVRSFIGFGTITVNDLLRFDFFVFQHITYNEWLPIVLGTDFMDELDIIPISHGYSSRYDKRVNPTIINSFASAAFRFGHTLIQGMLE